ncbi:shikimate dehydrogenase [Shouchella lonarensis]|uniref:Shikimate dehydrogenase (NADP(+)) n=1 Tax=Shouchella lonarensis TaxID=1464122 RepID=A0A1G6KFZ1_9BACI|nr:shikimate dehydrogenase [Shouchella lonarensis]SDC29758.1 shikimate dehydrogenase [Shouchella lonarensis]
MERKYGLIGHPVSHSLSPQMHAAAYQSLHLDATYEAMDVPPVQLKAMLHKVRAGNIDGLNVTLPHKVAVLPYLDELDEDAHAIGAVNTIVRCGHRLIGKNTDGTGYMTALLARVDARKLACANVLVIGAGGAARAIVYALCKHGVGYVTVANRTLTRAQQLVAHFPQWPVKAAPLLQVEEDLSPYDVLIQTTSVGMTPHVREIPLSLETLAQHTFVSEIIYHPIETALIKTAKARGNKTSPGIGMFVEQAALSIYYWTQRWPDRVPMTETVLKLTK